MDIRVCEAFCVAIFPKMLKSYDFMILWEECVLLEAAKVSNPNLASFIPNSLLLVLFRGHRDSHENALKR